MKYITAFLIKFIVITAVLFVVLELFYDVGFGDVLAISLILSGVSYLGDVFVLPRTSNTVATFSDLGLTFFLIWLVGGLVIEETIPLAQAAVVSSFIIAVGEAVFHMYMERKVFEEDGHHESQNNFSKERFSTETAEENPVAKPEDDQAPK